MSVSKTATRSPRIPVAKAPAGLPSEPNYDEMVDWADAQEIAAERQAAAVRTRRGGRAA